MKAFRVRGKFLMGRTRKRFTQEVAAPDAENAVERVLSTLGSRHRVQRKHIDIDTAEEIPLDEVTNPAVSRPQRKA